MTSSEFSISHIHQGIAGDMDTGTRISIYTKAIRMGKKSEEEEREIYEDRVYIKIEPPGQVKSVVDRAIRDADKERFQVAWEKFESGKESEEGGIPIERLGDLPTSRYSELRAAGIRTIEQMANIPDARIAFIGPDSLNLKKEAQLILADRTEDSVKLEELEAENADMKNQMAGMQQAIDELTAAEAKPIPKKRGRPPKNDTADDSTGCAERTG